MNRLYEEKYSKQGCLMKIVEYKNTTDIVVEFQDNHKARVKTTYGNFKLGSIKNPYHPTVHGVGMTGNKYPTKINGRNTKEYDTWASMLQRCFKTQLKEKQPAYKNVSCCDEWLYFENFYEWLHNQDNFVQWHKNKYWAIDKDILNKSNKIYSPENCCLIPQNVNCLFLKREAERGRYPIGVRYTNEGFLAVCRNPFLDRTVELGHYSTPEKAFNAYKKYKEMIIKEVARVEYEAGNITEECYKAMLKYEVEIDD